jgi:carbon-monoxide dehydrogenase large subunit
MGAPIKRREDPRLLTGRGHYVGDFRLPDMVHAAFLRSPHAHARVRRIDVSEARKAPGVLAIFTADDLGEVGRPIPMMVPHPALRVENHPPLAVGRVRFVGEPVAVVVAADRYLAEDAAERIAVDYEVLPAVVDAAGALRPEAPLVHDHLGSNLAARFGQGAGDFEAAARQTHRLLRERIVVSRGGGHSMETRGLVAHHDPVADRLTVWASTQAPHLLRRNIAQMLGWLEQQVRVVAPDVGGGFGPKMIIYPEDIVVPWLALRLGRPVKWIEDRREHFLTTVQEREQVHDVEVAVRADGTILGLRNHFLVDTGAYVPWGVIVPFLTGTQLLGPYRVSNYSFETTVVYTHRVPMTVVRGAGRPQATFVMERVMDRIAEACGLDPAEVRRRNFIQPQEFPYDLGLRFRDGAPMMYDSGNYPEMLRRALDRAAYETARGKYGGAAADNGCLVGVGVACNVEGTAIGPYEGATIRVDPQGKVLLITGASPQGQGHETALAQVCAQELGVPLNDIKVITGDTETIAFGIGAFASRVGAVAAGAIHLAAAKVREKALVVGSLLLEATQEDLEYREGEVFVRGAPARAVSLGQLAAFAAGRPSFKMPGGIEPGLEATRYFHPPASAFSSGANVVVVSVDPETGDVKILHYVAVHDCGRVINPMIVEGQMHGGLAHGIGNALYEDAPVDASGQPLAATFMDYLLPTAAEVPPFETDHLETPTHLNPAGVKGAGEGGTIPAPAAIVAAIENALAPLGVRINEAPLSPQKIRGMILEAKAAQVPVPG